MADVGELKTYADYQKFNFFRLPEWRWERVLQIVDRPDGIPGRCTRRDDDYIRKARNFRLRWEKDDGDERQRLLWEYPGLFYAYEFNEKCSEEPDAAMFVQARLLSGQPIDQIADAMGIMPQAIDWYSALFFDVRDRLKNRDWITKQVIVPALTRYPEKPEKKTKAKDILPFRDSTVAKPFLDGTLKLFAYFGGPLITDVMIGGLQSGKPLTSLDELPTWLDHAWTTILRRRSVQASPMFEINKYNVLELFAVHTRIMEIEKSQESATQTQNTTQQHVKALVDEIPWAIGDDGEKLYSGTVVGKLDTMASELRDEEVLKLASGQTVAGLGDNFPKALPAPRRDKRSVLMATQPDL